MDVDRDLPLFNPITKSRENETIKIFYFFPPFGFLKKIFRASSISLKKKRMNINVTSILTSPNMLDILIAIDFLCYRIRLVAEGGRAKGKEEKNAFLFHK